MAKKSKLKNKRLRLQLRATSLELEEVKEELDEFSSLFFNDFKDEIAYREKKKIDNLEKALDEEAHADEEEEEEEEKEETNPIIQKLYRSIARVAHPDICKDDEIAEKFKEAAAAYADGDWVTLLVIAEDVGVDIPDLPPETLAKIEQSIDELGAQINQFRSSIAYAWGEASDDEREMMRLNVWQIFGITDLDDFENFKKNLSTGS
tara:strand:- start:70 stop:687 length:618 start_codon:yes stop_codon:yes gene_type:complete